MRSLEDLLVNAINVILGFNGNAAVPWDEFVLAGDTLRALEFGLAIVPVASVQDDSILVGAHLRLDTGKSAAQSKDDV